MPSRPKPRPAQQALISDPERRRRLGASFADDTSLEEARRYDAVRPRYPDEMVDQLLRAAGSCASVGPPVVADLGAGTGILTRALLARGASVHAVEPSAAMTEVMCARSVEQNPEQNPEQSPGQTRPPHRLQVHRTTAEATGLQQASCDVVVAAQAWHWFDDALVQDEVRRILRPQGVLGVVANYLDTSVPWVHRLTRIMRAGDVYRPGWTPPVDPARFIAWDTTQTRWERQITPEQIRELSTTLSSWLSAEEPARARRRANLDWYLDEHLELTPGEPVALPYLTVLHTSVSRVPGAPVS
ncbi:methyltransferase domain-containing protein [Nesterenkonia sp. AY15]|uniref:class I SAM-dependent methyltransferase n=1 Tax=Nesterenkonia sp. AY15 TaxID=2901139 RepID=UPI001F4CAC36|nr:methyltransferase domain-containing protein [Nesterenkonia sp. AY15]